MIHSIDPVAVPTHAEVLIVGAGLSGGVVARELAQAGVGVVCLEQGEYPDRETYPGQTDEWELAALGPWHASPNVRRSAADYPIEDSRSDIKPVMFNGVGGGTILYGAHWMRFLPSDFRVHTLDDAAQDWPISYDELAPFYDQVDIDFGASGVAGDPAYPARPEFPMPPLPIGPWGERVAAAHNRLGWHWWPGSNAILSRPYDQRRPCVQRGTCPFGCNEGAKASVDITHWPKAIRSGARLITGACVSRLTLARGGRVTGAVFRIRGGAEREIAADVVVMAANAVGTPRLLLASAQGGASRGIANRSGLVGRNLMMHPFTRVIGLFDEDMGSNQGHWGQSLYSLQFAETDAERGYLRGTKWNLGPSGGPLQAALFPWPDEPSWGPAFHEHVALWLRRSAIWGISCDDLPEPENRVELDPVLKDSDGNPAPRVTYRISDAARRMLAFNVERAKESLTEAGAFRTVAPPLLNDVGWHPLGTCRMGRDPERSVVDADHRAHDHPNLYIVDGSVFVTGSSVNPSCTIAALSLRAARHMLATRGRADA